MLAWLPLMDRPLVSQRHARIKRSSRDIRIEGRRLLLCARNIAVQRWIEPHFAKLAQDNRTELSNVKRRRTQCDERLSTRLPVVFPECNQNPLGERRERSPRLLKLCQRPPLALKDGERGRMERITLFEASASKMRAFASVAVVSTAVHSGHSSARRSKHQFA
jgi:hypothetical protein